jgi:hypothetical protein
MPPHAATLPSNITIRGLDPELNATLVTTDPHFKAIPLLDVLYAD